MCWNVGVLVCCSVGICLSLLEYVNILETWEALVAKVVKVSNHSVPT